MTLLPNGRIENCLLLNKRWVENKNVFKPYRKKKIRIFLLSARTIITYLMTRTRKHVTNVYLLTNNIAKREMKSRDIEP